MKRVLGLMLLAALVTGCGKTATSPAGPAPDQKQKLGEPPTPPPPPPPPK